MAVVRRLSLVLCFTALVQHVVTIDGDTFWTDLSQTVTVPFLDGTITTNLRARQRVRLLGVDTAERGYPGYAEAATFTDQWLKRPGEVTVEACARDSFGRWLGTVRRGNESLSDALIRAGHAVKR